MPSTHRLEQLVRTRRLTANQTALGKDSRLAIPSKHLVLHCGDGRPLPDRRRGRAICFGRRGWAGTCISAINVALIGFTS